MENTVTTWFELYSPDTEASKKFYADVFGWSAEDMDMGDFQYPMFAKGGPPFAGMMSLNSPDMKDVPPNWLIYFFTEDINASCEKVKSGGGTVVNGPMEIPGVGHIAIISDTHGAHFAIHQPAPQQ